MKISKLIIVIVLTLLMGEVKAQNWAPDGAEWYYSYFNYSVEGFVKIQVAGDTTIEGINCKKLEKIMVKNDFINNVTDTNTIGYEYMYSDEDRVYTYVNEQFYTLYDFSAQVGDTWEIPMNDDLGDFCGESGEIIVEEIGTVTINNQELRKILVKPLDDSFLSFSYTNNGTGVAEIVEKIGPIASYMLPEPTCVADVHEGGELRCYSDNEFGYYSTGVADQCDYVISVPNVEELNCSVYPVPCNDILNIDIQENKLPLTITIYDLMGREVMSYQLKEKVNQINVERLNPGIYLIKSDTRFKNMVFTKN